MKEEEEEEGEEEEDDDDDEQEGDEEEHVFFVAVRRIKTERQASKLRDWALALVGLRVSNAVEEFCPAQRG
eukprot:2269532-Pyramimonas_sp.AAC.1